MLLNPSKQKGVALIQVLLISAVVSLLALQFTFTSRNQVQMASDIEARVQAQLNAYSVQQQALFITMTQERYIFGQVPEYFNQLEKLPPNGVTVRLNEKISIRIQDMGALFSIHSAQHPVFLDFLSYIGYSDIEAATISRFFVDLQDNDDYNIIGEPENIEALYGVPNPNRRLQLEQELDIYLQLWPKLYEYKDLFHTYSIYIMNMLQSPAPILYGSLGPDIGQNIINSRYDEDFSTFTLKRMMESKYGPEVTSTSSSGIYRISVIWESDELLWEQANDVILRRMSRPPFSIINRIN